MAELPTYVDPNDFRITKDLAELYEIPYRRICYWIKRGWVSSRQIMPNTQRYVSSHADVVLMLRRMNGEYTQPVVETPSPRQVSILTSTIIYSKRPLTATQTKMYKDRYNNVVTLISEGSDQIDYFDRVGINKIIDMMFNDEFESLVIHNADDVDVLSLGILRKIMSMKGITLEVGGVVGMTSAIDVVKNVCTYVE